MVTISLAAPFAAQRFDSLRQPCYSPFCPSPFLSEVNLVNLERVGFNLRNFDMVFIWKDLNRDVGRIDSIPSTSLDTIKVGP
jgi:nucleosome binding factor SPN SPT16 subunit